MIMPIPYNELKKEPLKVKGGENLAYLLFELSGLSSMDELKKRLTVHSEKRKKFELENKGGEEKKGVDPGELLKELKEAYERFKKEISSEEMFKNRIIAFSIDSRTFGEDHLWPLFSIWLRIKAEELAEEAKKGE